MATVGPPDNRNNRVAANRARAFDLGESVVSRYLSGESELSIANSLGISRGPVRRTLMESGIEIRGRSSAGRVRAARMTPTERKAQVADAHEAVRGTTWRASDNLGRAETIEAEAVSGARKRSDGEIRLGAALTEAGLHFVPEKAVAGYNLDFALAPVAVELLGGSWHSTPDRRTYHAKRAEAILSEGWGIIYVWSTHYMPLAGPGTEKLIALIKRARRDPSTPGKHWVVRGDGHVMAEGSGDVNDDTFILPTQRHLG